MPTRNLLMLLHTVTDFDDEGRVGNSLAEILTLNIVQNIEAKVWSIFLS